MKLPGLASVGIVASVFAFVPMASEPQWNPARTPWGEPDLQGVWTNYANTPFERPTALQGRAVLTDEELAMKVAEAEKRARDEKADRPQGGGVGAGPEHWYEQGRPSARSSMIVDPP